MTADAKFTVTVPGPDFTADVSWAQVRCYLRAKGWGRQPNPDDADVWADPHDPRKRWPTHRVWCGFDGKDGDECDVKQAIIVIARVEARHPADVLRAIAAISTERPELYVVLDRESDAMLGHGPALDAGKLAESLSALGHSTRTREATEEERRQIEGRKRSAPACPDVDRVGAGARAEAALPSEEELAFLVRLLAKSEPRPWAMTADGAMLLGARDLDRCETILAKRVGGTVADMELMFRSVNALDRLIATVRAQRQELAALTATHTANVEELGAEIARLRAEADTLLCREMSELLVLADVRAAVAARDGEDTVGAVKRVVAISEAWKALAHAERDVLQAQDEAEHAEADERQKAARAKLRALGIDPDAS